MTPDQRRDQLLRVGVGLFSARPYDDVHIEEIAARAGVSRGLMYRYFPTKRDLFRAIVTDATERLQTLTDPDPSLPMADRLIAGLDRFLEHFETNIEFVRAVNYGAAAADDDIQAILARSRRRHEDRILNILAQHGVAVTPVLRVATRGWLLMTRNLALDWLDTREISRDELRNLCARTGLQMLLGGDDVRLGMA
jgi:AcrR family transcriptional regulator